MHGSIIESYVLIYHIEMGLAMKWMETSHPGLYRALLSGSRKILPNVLLLPPLPCLLIPTCAAYFLYT